jgi:hypothetical protein
LATKFTYKMRSGGKGMWGRGPALCKQNYFKKKIDLLLPKAGCLVSEKGASPMLLFSPIRQSKHKVILYTTAITHPATKPVLTLLVVNQLPASLSVSRKTMVMIIWQAMIVKG